MSTVCCVMLSDGFHSPLLSASEVSECPEVKSEIKTACDIASILGFVVTVEMVVPELIKSNGIVVAGYCVLRYGVN